MNSKEAQAVVAGLAVVGVIFLGKAAIDSENAPDRAINSAQTVAEKIEHKIQADSKVDVAAAIVRVDGGVNFRSSPVLVNTNNADMLSGNVLPNVDTSETPLDKPLLMIRPIIVENEDRLSSDDPEYWLAGLENNRLVWVGINEDTKQHVQAYQRPETNGSMPDFTQDITVAHVSPNAGIIFKSTGYMASAGLIRELSGPDDPYLGYMDKEGYREVSLPLN